MDKVNEALDKANTFLDSLSSIGEAVLVYVLPILILSYVVLAFCGIFKKWEYGTLKGEAFFIKTAKTLCGCVCGIFRALQSKILKWSMVCVLILYIVAIILYFTLR